MLNKALPSLFLLFPVLAFAQTDSAATNKPLPAYGLKVGLNFATVKGKMALPEEAYTARGGGVYGFLVDIPVTRQLGVELNLFYSGKGYFAEMQGLHADSTKYFYTGEGYFSYLELPVLLQFHLPAKTRRFSLVVGPQFSYLLRRKEEIYRRDGLKLLWQETEERKGMNTMVMGLTYGAHLNLRLFRLGVRFIRDVSNAGTKDRAYFGAPMRNQVTQIELAFLVGKIKPKYTGKPI